MLNTNNESAMSVEARKAALELSAFIEKCPSMFHTTAEISDRLKNAGFTFLPEGEAWSVERGGKYFTTRNGSTVVAFKVGEQLDNYHFQITAAHGDSPTFKLKAQSELEGPGEYMRLNTEVYGGAIDYTWFDKPLGLAGRVLVREGGRIESRLYDSARDVALIPSLAIHMDRSVNEKFSPNRQTDLMPLFSAGALTRGALDEYVASELGVSADQVISRDMFLVNRQKPQLWGAAEEFLSAPKLDDLACAFVSLEAFLAVENDRDVSVYCCFDNEEVGSNTKQGAMSTVLRDTLERMNAALGFSWEDYHCPVLGGGMVVKEAANQKYCTDAFSRAAFLSVCEAAGVPVQTFANRSDMAGGSTLGNLSNTQVSMHGVDVGLPQLAMHSSYETCAACDVKLSIDALKAFFDAEIVSNGSDSIELK